MTEERWKENKRLAISSWKEDRRKQKEYERKAE
jgi:hypothetical protein